MATTAAVVAAANPIRPKGRTPLGVRPLAFFIRKNRILTILSFFGKISAETSKGVVVYDIHRHRATH